MFYYGIPIFLLHYSPVSLSGHLTSFSFHLAPTLGATISRVFPSPNMMGAFDGVLESELHHRHNIRHHSLAELLPRPRPQVSPPREASQMKHALALGSGSAPSDLFCHEVPSRHCKHSTRGLVGVGYGKDPLWALARPMGRPHGAVGQHSPRARKGTL